MEGGEVYLIPSIVDKLKNAKQLLDYENTTVSRVNGKGSFLVYIKMLKCFNIPFLILRDLDCFKDEVPKLVKHLNIIDIKANTDLIKAALSDLPVNYEGISERIKNVDKNYDAQKLQSVFEQFANNEITADNEDLITIVDYMKSRYTKGNKELAILNAIGQDVFDQTLSKLRENNIFIWAKGDLETYYSDKTKLLKGGSKDLKALELSYLLQVDTEKIEDLLLHTDEISLLVETILAR